ncbi:DNA topoisomerase (ATP-hydrolyzing) [Clostridium tetani]|uniref:DNA topoisomerase (ATP-hydrolyzing) n=1 Tax=Clostridium tetani (strain Massachusetts / E88) TaxID=212717 RepID=Q893P6_CLOTE|nr:DNA topoisomerase IV subunit A [Clostridium tetani]AAO36296.1 DNA gyrase subunit A [Clostridium tetani E88]KGI37740.1 DNA topoisomerase IV subunit A [Clostridium tetani]KGI39666.1 DNA topoisomerase IV subunit A [Clostridium tetani ATCC 9441]KGI45539.1 DNA topoisomerase IV subunit A [Clostridium tetani]KHO31833.1 DNA topoisomerase IV subunit A [Clostridium tetani]
MTKKKLEIPKDNNIIEMPIEEAMPENYLPYAAEVAKDRALPDVRDGLKPVHRRILYGAYKLAAFPDKPYYKSARIVGDILGKYHPHGDTSVYDAMVILAQDFTTRMPLIDGHGNWGSIDGDSAAAMRYTEARLTPMALELLRDIDKDVVNMEDNYSSTEKEPEVLPSRYPNLLVNGAFGIAVGLATNIPPHNLVEVIDGTLAYIDNNEIDTKELMKYIKGPDLPTGGILIGKNSLLKAYENGIGKVSLRAKTQIEEIEKGRFGIVITEFPYRKNKSKLLQNISEMTGEKRHSRALEYISDIRDESDRNGIRAVIEFKRSTDREIVEKTLKYLYKNTDMQINISFNMVALANGKPEVMGLKTMIYHYVEHQKEVVRRRSEKELEIAENRFHIVEGFIKAIDIMDEIIKTIRASKSKKEASKNLIDKFNFTKVQSEAILELMLYRLTGLEVTSFKKEHKELEKKIKALKKILQHEEELLKVIKFELEEVREKYGDKRKTLIIKDDEKAKIDIEDLIIDEETVITISKEGFCKRVSVKSYNRSNSDIEDIEYREGDYNKFLLEGSTKDNVLIFTNKGNMYSTKVINIPEKRWKDRGIRLDETIKTIDLNEEEIIDIYVVSKFTTQNDFIFITSRGGIKKTSLDKFETNYSKLMALKLREDEEVIDVKLMDKNREEKFLKLSTKMGLDFTIEEPTINEEDRNILSNIFCSIGYKDKVIKSQFEDKNELAIFSLNVNKNGSIIKGNRKNKSSINLEVDSNKKLLIFLKNGEVIKINCNMLQNLEGKAINIFDLLEKYEQKNEIINVLPFDYNDEDLEIYYLTKFGLVKKTLLKEFQGDYFITIGYKFRHKEDEIITVDFGKAHEEKDIIIISEKGMCIRFSKNSINPVGKIASGVMGINLKKEDKVLYGFINTEIYKSIVLTFKEGKDEEIKLKDIISQNRAGKGNSILNADKGVDGIKSIYIK